MKQVIFCWSLCLLGVLHAQAQSVDDAWRFSQRLPAVGARLTALSGTSAAGLADYGVLYSNPAGLGYYTHSEIAGGLSWLNARDAAIYHTPTRFDWESELRATDLDHLAAVYKAPTVRGSLVLGLAYARTADFTRRLYFQGENNTSSITDSYLPYPGEYEVTSEGQLVFHHDIPFMAYQAGAIEFLPDEYQAGRYPFYQAVAPGTTIRQIGEVTEEGGLNELSLGAAIEAARNLFLGFSLGFTSGRYRFERRFEEEDFRNENTEALYAVVLNENRVLAGFDFLQVREYFTSRLEGFSMRGGLSARLSPQWRFGVSIETPVFFRVREDYGSVLETFFDTGGSLAYGGQSGDAGTGTFRYEIRTPWRLRTGIAYQTSRLHVSLDLEAIDWSQLRFDAASNQAFIQDLNRRVREELEPVLNARLGLAYQLGSTTLYGGLAVFPDPHTSEIQRSEADRQRVWGSLGISLQLAESFRLDLGWTQEQFDDYYQPYADVERPPFVRETVRRSRFVVGLSYTLGSAQPMGRPRRR